MPFVIASLLVQIMLATHAVRTGRAQLWLWIIIVLPGIGSLLYVVIELLPEFFAGPAGQRAARDVTQVINPERDYRHLLAEFEVAPTVANKTRLAEECLRIGRNEEAVELYRGCLSGLHEHDVDLMLGLARAYFAANRYGDAVAAFNDLRARHPNVYSVEAHLIYARALEESGRTEGALAEYAVLADTYPGEEARCRYGLLLQKTGAIDAAMAQFRAVVSSVNRRNRQYRRAQAIWFESARRMLPV